MNNVKGRVRFSGRKAGQRQSMLRQIFVFNGKESDSRHFPQLLPNSEFIGLKNKIYTCRWNAKVISRNEVS